MLCGHSQKGYDAELIALDILEKEGYEIIYSQEKSKRTPRKQVDPNITKMWNNASNKLIQARRKYKAPLDHNTKNISDNVRKIMKKEHDEFYKADKIHHNALTKISEKEKKPISLMKQHIGKSIMPEINRNEWIKFYENSRDKEEDPTVIVRYGGSMKGYFQRRIDSLKSGKSLFELTYVDIFCKKDTSHYVFDVKHKTFKENKNVNIFYVTNYEVLNFNRIVKESKVKLKILIILEKGKKSFYKIYDWNEFIVPSKFDPNKQRKTSVRLEKGLDISSLNERI